MREQEHSWEPFGPAMVTRLKASLDGSGRIADWHFDVWTNTHSMRPGGAGSMLAAQHMAQPFAVPPPEVLPLPAGGGDRNAIPIYKFPNAKVVHHFIPEMPVRISAMRALGAYHNVFSIESFMDELAAAAGADPIEFRLKHLEDKRGREVIEKAAQAFGWQKGQKAPQGRAMALPLRATRVWRVLRDWRQRWKSTAETGRPRLVRAVAAVDSGQVVNPDGLTNQIEGAIVQSMSWNAVRGRHLRRHANYQHRLADLSDPALRCGPRHDRGPHHQPARPAIPRQRRNRAGTGGSLDRQRHRQRHRKTASATCR